MPTATGHTAAIRASKVIGTDVLNKAGENIGKVEDIVLDKNTSQIMFAVLSIGGAVTTSENFYPLPWAVLDYDKDAGGYLVPFTKDQIVKGPADSMSALMKDDGAGARTAAYGHYKVAKDW